MPVAKNRSRLSSRNVWRAGESASRGFLADVNHSGAQGGLIHTQVAQRGLDQLHGRDLVRTAGHNQHFDVHLTIMHRDPSPAAWQSQRGSIPGQQRAYRHGRVVKPQMVMVVGS